MCGVLKMCDRHSLLMWQASWKTEKRQNSRHKFHSHLHVCWINIFYNIMLFK